MMVAEWLTEGCIRRKFQSDEGCIKRGFNQTKVAGRLAEGYIKRRFHLLARAGKVWGQTPKIAKQDKKKKLRGRAHKRMQYNRRFLTVVVGFGKKRGPNSS
ncbi:hypothetical protein CsatB_022621 [Cannabis sativa]